MAVRIRLMRAGTHKRPFYRVVAAESRAPRDGRFLDILGTYDPLQNPALIQMDEEKTMDWLKKGAEPSDTAKQILKKSGITAKMNEAPQAV